MIAILFLPSSRTHALLQNMASSTSGLWPKHSILHLYRGILRIHRHALPPDARALGDRYVKDEWRRHAKSAPKHVRIGAR